MENFVENEGPVAVAIEIIPKDIFLKWLNGVEKDLDLVPTKYDMLTSDTNIYLAPLESYEEDIEGYLDNHYETVFKSELETWSLETEKWPHKRTREMFNEWFEYKTHNLINMIEVE